MGQIQQISFAVYSSIGQDNKFGTQDRLLKDLAKLAKDRDVDFFVFVPGFSQDLATEAEGYRLNMESMEWERERCPWPQVVLRRLVHYPPRLKSVVQEEEWLFEKRSRLITLPRRLGNKWGTYLWLQKDPQLKKYLPKTRVMKPGDELSAYFESMDDFYIKPVLGTQGEQIIRVQKNGQGFVLASSQKQSGTFAVAEEKDLEREVSQILSGKNAIVQETIPAMRTLRGETIDLRYLVQAVVDHHSPSVFTIARVGKQGGITTNLHTGGQALSVRKASELLPPSQAGLWKRGVLRGEQVAQKIFQLFHEQYPNLAELGVDLAVDQAGRVFWMEINPCPGRRMLRAVSPHWRMKSLERIVDYAQHIATRNF